MAVYTVHAPAGYGVDARDQAERLVFVRDGFYFWAFLLTVLWLLWHRLWLGLIGYIAVSFGAEVVMRALGADRIVHMTVMFLIALLLGLEAGSLRRWKLSRGKWRQIGVVIADNVEDAERRFFTARAEAASPYRPSSPLHPLPRASLPSEPVVGLFPEPGPSR